MRWRIAFRTDGWVCICNSRILLKANKPANNNGRRTQVLVGDNHVKLEALFVRHEQVQLDRPFQLLLRLSANHQETKTLVLRLGLPLILEIRNVMVQRHVQHLPGLSNRAEERIVGPRRFLLLTESDHRHPARRFVDCTEPSKSSVVRGRKSDAIRVLFHQAADEVC